MLSKDSLASVQQKAAEDFIQSQLYGPGSRRTTSKTNGTITGGGGLEGGGPSAQQHKVDGEGGNIQYRLFITDTTRLSAVLVCINTLESVDLDIRAIQCLHPLKCTSSYIPRNRTV